MQNENVKKPTILNGGLFYEQYRRSILFDLQNTDFIFTWSEESVYVLCV